MNEVRENTGVALPCMIEQYIPIYIYITYILLLPQQRYALGLAWGGPGRFRNAFRHWVPFTKGIDGSGGFETAKVPGIRFGEQVKQVPSGSWGKLGDWQGSLLGNPSSAGLAQERSIGDNPFTSRHDIACVASPGVLFALPGETGM